MSRAPAVEVQTVVVGAGVIGLSIARALAAFGREVVVLEQANGIGTATSSRNSSVIHAGIYYPPGSLKARLCVRGRELLYEFCARRDVRHARCGKLIVATNPEEIAILHQYETRAYENGAGRLNWLSPTDVAELEPEVACLAALSSSTTGIIDVHELTHALAADIESTGGHIVLNTALGQIDRSTHGFDLRLSDGRDTRVRCRELINAAGLEAHTVAARIAGLESRFVPSVQYARGHYYSLSRAAPFRRLIYPIADKYSLGIHATLDLTGRVRFGPDVEWIESVDYGFRADLREAFTTAIRRYYPAIDPNLLSPDYTGIRPKIYGPDDPVADFRIDDPTVHGIAGLVNLFGIESPGLTASLAIAEVVAASLTS